LVPVRKEIPHIQLPALPEGESSSTMEKPQRQARMKLTRQFSDNLRIMRGSQEGDESLC
jgi:hypothetical protein